MVLVGARLNRPDRRLPWYLISAALACFVTGDSVYNLILRQGHTPAFPGPADVLYLLVYPLLTAAFLGEVVDGIELPRMLSLLALHDPGAVVVGLDAVPPDQVPPVNVVRIAFQVMVGLGTLLAVGRDPLDARAQRALYAVSHPGEGGPTAAAPGGSR